MSDYELRHRFRRLEQLLHVIIQQTGTDPQKITDLTASLANSEAELQAAIDGATPAPPASK